uniref:Uncharacterized protein n=1 Tax=Parastrongyloides trichosuri TaxID=131310 RepID=A0A0N4Z571_PARTI
MTILNSILYSGISCSNGAGDQFVDQIFYEFNNCYNTTGEKSGIRQKKSTLEDLTNFEFNRYFQKIFVLGTLNKDTETQQILT